MTDSKPKKVSRDELAYMIVAAGLAAYAESGDIRILALLVGLYAVGNITMRTVSQVLEARKAGSND